MNSAPTTSDRHSLAESVLRALIVGVLAMLGFYLKVLGGILKLGIRMIRKAPLEGRSQRA